MTKNAKIWLIVAASLTLIGCMIFGGVMTVLKWDFTKLSTDKYETNTHEISNSYKNLSIITDTSNITLVPSEDSQTSVVCYEQTIAKHTVTVKDDTLSIEINNTRKWYNYIGINFGEPNITVYIPKGEYGTLSIISSTGHVEIPKDYKFESINISQSTGDVTNYASALEGIKIRTTTGSILIDGIYAGSLDLSVSTGKMTASNVDCDGDIAVSVSTGKARLTNVACKSVISTGDTGDITLNNVIAAEKLSIKRSTGDVKFEGCDAEEIFVKTDTGDVEGTLLSEKVFIIDTDTGHKDVPNSITGGRCEISTDTGDIKIKIEK